MLYSKKYIGLIALILFIYSISIDAKLVNSDGSYETVPLEKDTVTLAVIQTGINSLQDFDDPKVGLRQNLDHMIDMGEKACAQNPKPDFLLFHEFPLTGYSSGSRTEKLKYTIQVPGPETIELGKLSKKCDAYLIFGSYATDPDWPQHILSINAVLGRDGSLKKAYW